MTDEKTQRCYICDGLESMHTATNQGHKFWSYSDAERQFKEEDRRSSSSYDAAAKYVSDYRPY